MEVRVVDPVETRPLRQRVLRPHQTIAELAHPNESHPATGAFGAFEGELMVGTALVFPADRPGSTFDGPWRLVAMAVDPDHRRLGIGAELLIACMGYVRRHGGEDVWCHARTDVIEFYEALGFTVEGPAWMEEHTGPHVLMWRSSSS